MANDLSRFVGSGAGHLMKKMQAIQEMFRDGLAGQKYR